jgi:hypothetical protein
MRGPLPFGDYVARQLANGRSKKEILRLLKRAIAREVFRLLTRPGLVDDYSDLRPARHAKNLSLAIVAHHFGVPDHDRLAARTRTATQRHSRSQLPPMAHRRLTS